MRGMAFKSMIAFALLVLTGFAVRLAVADNGGGEAEIEIKAPLEAVNCASVPPTITVLGLNIDIGTAAIEQGEDDEDGAGGALACAGLTLGRVVEVELASDIPNATTGLLTALKVDAEGEECDDDCVEIEAPLQAVDPIGHTITVLGLVIDISQAEIEGDDEGDDEGDGQQPADASQLIVGQLVEAKLASNLPPFVATELEIKHFNNGVEIEIVDQNGDEVEDDDDDIEIQAIVTVAAAPAAPGAKAAKAGKKVVTFHARSNGRTVLNGLPPGRARLVVTRVKNGKKSSGKGSAVIQPQTTTYVVTRLKGK